MSQSINTNEIIHTVTIDETDQATLTIEVLDLSGSAITSETKTDVIPGIWALDKDEDIRDAIADHFGLGCFVLGAPGGYSLRSGRATYTMGGREEA